ncbi:MAG: hypothetical protein J5661_04765 [Bacteroidaceae bacterium]|nr:hypothetical protein [Bacteroidaceae bacterium]
MTTFEDKLQASAQRLAAKENMQLHVPQNPLKQKNTYWGWVATPAATVIGLIFGMSLPLFMGNEKEARYVHLTDTLRIVQPVHDTLYLTQIVERERVIEKRIPVSQDEDSEAESPDCMQEEEEETTCTSIQCDGINYSILASN